MATITHLPNELLCNIFQRLELPDLQSVRFLESTKLIKAADLFLFKHIATSVFTSHVSLQERFEGLLGNQQIADAVRRVRLAPFPLFDTFVSSRYVCITFLTSRLTRSKDHPTPVAWVRAILQYVCNAAVSFPELNGIELDLNYITRLDPSILSRDPCLEFLPFIALSQLIHSMGNHGLPGPTREIRIFEVNALPPLPVSGVTDTSSFRLAMRHVESLSLVIGKWHLRPEDNAKVADYPASPETHQFCHKLMEIWGNCSDAGLTDFTARFTKYAGIYPKIELKSLSLSLTKVKLYKIASLDMRLFKQLVRLTNIRVLYLIQCCIAVMMDTQHAVDVHGSPIQGNFSGYINSYGFLVRWHEVFDLFFKGLPKLEDFRFAKLVHDDYEQTNGVVLYLNEIQEGLYPERYLEYDQGHMVYHDAANATHESSLQRDAAALARLPTKSLVQNQEADQQDIAQAENTQEPTTDEELNGEEFSDDQLHYEESSSAHLYDEDFRMNV